MKRITTKEFIERAKAVHGDRFDYSKTEYVGRGDRVVIGCPVHGDISVVASGHVSKGLGCNKCYFDSVKKKHTEKFLKKSKDVHGDGYDYSLVDYKNTDTKIKIVCPKHGVFETTPYRHMNGVGCPECNGPKYRGFLKQHKKTKLTKKMFVERSRKVHGNKYDYSRSIYISNRKKTEIICATHGSFFQEPSNHMNGVGCPKCHFETTAAIFKNNQQQLKAEKGKNLIADLIKVHGNKYDYSKAVYDGWYSSIEIICPIHGPFFQKVHNHKSGAGCPQCAPSGFDNTIPAILYYLEVKTENGLPPVYKIGITNRTVKQRYCLDRDREKIKIIKVWEYPIGFDAKKAERKILRLYKKSLYQGPPPLDGVGTAEMFSKDVLCLAEESE